jgi:hypothetical protein
MRFRLMASYRGAPYEVGLGPAESDVVLFAALPPPEELGFEPAPGHWRKKVSRAEVDALWESRPVGVFRGDPCLVLDDLGDRLHITYLGTDARRARDLGYWQVDRGVFELLAPRDEVSGLTEEKVEQPLHWAQPPAETPPVPSYPYGTAPWRALPDTGLPPAGGNPGPGDPGHRNGVAMPPGAPWNGSGYPGNGTGYTGNGTGYPGNGTGYPGNGTGYPGNETGSTGNGTGYPDQAAGWREPLDVPDTRNGFLPAPDARRPAPDAGTGRRGRAREPGGRAARRQRVPTRSIFSELADLAAIPRSAYALEQEADGAMCLIRTHEGFEVFSAADGARHEVRTFGDEEAAYFYLFGVLAAESVRNGSLKPPG